MKKSVLTLIAVAVLGTTTMSAQNRNNNNGRGNGTRQEMRDGGRQLMDNGRGNDRMVSGRRDNGRRNDCMERMELGRRGHGRHNDCMERMEPGRRGHGRGHVDCMVPVRRETHVIYADPRPVPPPPAPQRVVVYNEVNPGAVVAGAVAVGVLTALLSH